MPGSGIKSQFGFAAESTYGTAVTPNKFIYHTGFNITPVRNRAQGEGIQSGLLGPLGSHYVETTRAATASLSAEVTRNGWGRLLEAITGGTSTSALKSGGTLAYEQAHTLGDVYGKSLTLQGGRPTRGGTVVPATLKGGKVTSAEFSAEVGGMLTASVEFDGQDWDNTTALATAVYPSTSPWRGVDMCLKMGTYNSETNVAGVRSVSMSFTRSLDTEDFNACGAGLKAEPVINGLYEITGSISADWTAKATFEDLAVGSTQPSLVWLFEGSVIEATTKQMLKFTLPGVTLDAAAQGVDGIGELTTDWNYTWKYNGTNLPRIDVITTDTAL